MKALIAASLICAAGVTNAFADDAGQRLSALMKVSPDKEFVMIKVPTASSFIANKLALAALKSGTDSAPALNIATMLQRPAPANLAVTSDNDSIGAATLERAFDSLKGKTVTPQEVAYIGKKESGEALAAKAEAIGVTLLVVPFE